MRSYHIDLKTRVIEYYQNTSDSYRKVSLIFGVSKSSIWRWLNKNDEPRDSSNKKIIELIRSKLENGWIGRIKDIVEMIRSELGIDKSISTIWRIIKELGYSYKRLRKKVIKNSNDSNVKEKFKEKIRRKGYEKVLCFDEVGFQLEMVPRYGWSKKGERCYYKSSKGGRENYTGSFLISTRGIEKYEIKKETMKTEGLLNFFELNREDLKGYKLVLDNLRAHHNKEFKEKLKKIGLCGEWLPPYSPDLNPIEEVFGWIKRALRYKIIKSEKELLLEVKKLVNKINEKGTLNYYKHSYD